MVKAAILHEGKTDKQFLTQLLNDLALPTNLVQFYCMKSKSGFFKMDSPDYKELKTNIDSEQIEKVLFFIDADFEKDDSIYGGYEKTEAEINKVVKTLSLQNYTIYISCDPTTQQGNLESLILSTIPEQHQTCIAKFLECSEFESKENHKAILNQIYKLAYPKNPYNFEHPHFDALKEKLRQLLN